MTDLSLWQQIAGVAVATVLVLGWAVWCRRRRQAPGRHRPDQVARLTAASRALDALAPGASRSAELGSQFIDRAIRYRGQLAGMAVSGLMNPVDDLTDDWTADLPTAEVPLITALDLAKHYESTALAAAQFAAAVRSGELRHTSPSERARQRWGVECPIFAELADEYGYDLGGEFGELRHRPVAA
ncbi:hypothetical protein [[Mycobacterium] crassicus]|uniref:Secreted protein n=1 Tax=[Mycobacterium] crassicus TaxID=2872309 RepID=A0ABU5XL35_9MYCO|nr:hypothetical protein [Mycolicibacter sp. MYC098]MEB3022906.1 hypothetical protein [Mycolicibacter sp. MYC098]